MDHMEFFTPACTLISVIAVLVFIGLVVFGVLFAMSRSRQKRRLSEMDASLVQARSALETLEETHRRLIDQSALQIRECEKAVSDLKLANSVLETRLDQVPALEKSVSQWQDRCEHLHIDLRREASALAQAEEKGRRVVDLTAENRELRDRLASMDSTQAKQQATIAELNTRLEAERRQGAEKLMLLEQAKDRLTAEFENLAHRIFEEKGRKFADQNQAAVDRLITPLREQIGEFKKRVEDVYDKESRDRTALQTEIHHLKELNRQISKEATNLTKALKGDSKARGTWGEVVLERVLEASGLQKGREYDTQVSLNGKGGKRYQPDVIVHLPEQKDVIIDAKVSLTDYEAFYSAEDADLRARHLSAHITAVRNHVRGLSAKRYEELEGVRSLDFILMFVPIEAAFLAAVEQDRSLFSEAFEKNIILVSPSTLLVTLRTIENIWRHEYQNRNTLLIARKAGALYDKFVGFVTALEEVGVQLDRARDSYRLAHERLVSGRGNLVRRSQELKALGIKTHKDLPLNLQETDDD